MKKAFALTILIVLGAFSCPAHPVMYDFDGDGRSDFVIKHRNGTNRPWGWYIYGSQSGISYTEWGYEYSQPTFAVDFEMMGDYDGDGKWDLTVVRRATESSAPILWYVLKSSTGTMQVVSWGYSLIDAPVPQDYDGDGKMDFAVVRIDSSNINSNVWYILRSSDGQMQTDTFGRRDDFAFLGGDYDGDHKADLAVIRAPTSGQFPPPDPIPVFLYIKLSADGSWRVYSLGDGRETRLISGDYDGDGKSDVALWKPNGSWLWLRSSDNQWQGVNFGLSTDQPAPGDYDGDGKSDPAVFRHSGQACSAGAQNYYYVLQSRDGVKIVPWGAGCDFPAHDHYQHHGFAIF